MTKTTITRVALVVAMTAIIGCDRATKRMAATTLAGQPGQSFLADTVRLEYAENPAGFLSLGDQLSPAFRRNVFTIGTALALFAMVVTAIRLRWEGPRLVATGLLFAGGASNLVDRLTTGSVIDFMNVGIGPLRTGIFNVADVSIMIGAGMLLMAARQSPVRLR